VRLFAALAVVLALAAVASLPAGTSQLSAEQAAAAECHWKRHAKRVVKHVRRHGRLRKVVRWKPRWICMPQVVAPASALPAPTPVAPPPPPPAPELAPEPEANRLAVKSVEFYFVLSRPSVKAGELTVELNNRGEDPHNLNLRQEGEEGAPLEIPETPSLQRNVATFDLPAGQYRLWCSLPEHEERGMYTSLVVE
jgi:plastocyanin